MQTNKDSAQRYSDIPTLNEAWLDWLASPAGSKHHEQELALFREVLPHARGYALAVASLANPEELVGASKTAHQWWLKAHVCTQGEMTSVQIDSLQWPFEEDSLDVIVLHHTLDYAQWPHQTIREAARCLNDSGRLIVVGYNPFSVWGVGKMLFGRWSQKFPWLCRFINPWRVADWLTLLDCRVVKAYYTRPLLPWNFEALKKIRFLNKETDDPKKIPSGFWPGASYLLVCKPETPCLTPIQKDWRRRQFSNLPIAGRTVSGRAVNRQGVSRTLPKEP
ncbi:class I SAM-dependent methyltransferase [Litoribrevibacter euphylliae]|uniref:Class I SAM-dependent methyltransferase n=1 Tax=Litoribrevibacter euphylliae TaxID=1834034 RepID=A0ABV7HEK1_9GAMM